MKRSPAAMPTTPVKRLMKAGLNRIVVSPVPSCPASFAPQQATRPSARTAHVWNCPVAIATALVKPGTGDGVRWLRLLPSPCCPLMFEPQQATVPLARSAHV